MAHHYEGGNRAMESKSRWHIIGAVVLLLGAYTTAEAHHSAAMFDREKVLTLQGTVKSYAYAQPHSWIDLLVADPSGGEPVVWGVECGTTTAMRNVGVTPSVLKPGDKIAIRVHPLRDGRPRGSFIDVTLANGEVRGMAHGPTPTTAAPATPAAEGAAGPDRQ
jgi:Family of unknown function (DUF6152)